MSEGAAIAQTGQFIASRGGRRFRLVSEPASVQPCGTVVCVHAFAEEMNKSRRMVARAARCLAASGWRVVQRDLAGCGDSSGDFGDATWNLWLDDVREEVSTAQTQHPVWLWGIRAGALLACAALPTDVRCHLLLWQPVVSGAQHLQQFLRLHAGARIAGTQSSSGEQSPQQLLRAGQTVEVGGYQLNAALADGLAQASFDVPTGFQGHVVWIDVSAHEPVQMSPASRRCIDALVARGVPIDATAVAGPPFWQTQEIEDCDALLAQTHDRLTTNGRARALPADVKIDPPARVGGRVTS
jgi:exosortase A-associated hydrolase 2